MHINSNIPSLQAHQQLLSANRTQANSMRRLSTGLRVNSSSEDPANMAIANRMRRQLNGINAASQNSLDAISIIQTADGALAETNGILNRVRDLMVQSANDILTNDDRNAIQIEVDQLLDEIDRITTQATFNNRTLFAGTFEDANGNEHGVKQVRVGTGENLLMDLRIPSVHTSLLGRGSNITVRVEQYGGTYEYHEVYSLDALRNPNIEAPRISIPNPDFDPNDPNSQQYIYEMRFGVLENEGHDLSFASALLSLLDIAIAEVSEIRSRLGAYENRLYSTNANLEVQDEQLSEGLSRIVDTDMALEMSRLTQQQVLFQATMSIKAISNQRPQIVLGLLNF
ncbi:MAG: flagellin [Defluviitaleaceae bacterium]|nr:flagellin [Defluviitaleaceae bacterium]